MSKAFWNLDPWDTVGKLTFLCSIESMKFNYYTLKNNDGSALAECCKESLLKTIWNKIK